MTSLYEEERTLISLKMLRQRMGEYFLYCSLALHRLESKLKQPEAHVTTRYIWRTQHDGKVRASHAVNDGKIFSWDDPPATGHPGEDYNCRCWAEPLYEDGTGTIGGQTGRIGIPKIPRNPDLHRVSNTTPSMPRKFDVDKAAEYLHQHKSPKQWGDGKCAKNVAEAIRHSGVDLGRPEIREKEGASEPWARDYGKTLENAHFREVAQNGSSGAYPPDRYAPQKGDVVVILPNKDQNPAGHMAMYDGNQWFSDFPQDRDIWPNWRYQQEGATYKIYRHESRM